MLCYAALFFEQNIGLYTKYMSKILWSVMLSVMLSYDFLSKILCPVMLSVMLCLWWHELKSKILWYVMLVLFVSKILCTVMNLTVCYYVLDFCQDQLGKRGWKVLLYDDVVCFLVVLDSIFETLAHIWDTLRSLLNKLACLQYSVLLSKLAPLIETWEYPWHAFTNSQFDMKPCAEQTPITQYTLSAICLRC
jgi:hypothetical protein